MFVLLVFLLLELFTFGYAQTKCITPNGQGAQCIPFKQCDVFKNAVLSNPSEEVKRFLRESHCGNANDQPLVCCGSVANFKTLETQDNIFPHLNSTPIIDGPFKLNLATHKNLNLLPSKTECGVFNFVDYLPRDKAHVDEYTWLALLEYKMNGSSTGYNCGGILISSRYVLTAAHCVTGRIEKHAGNLFRVRLGENDLRTNPDCSYQEFDNSCGTYQDIDVEEIISHPSYNLTGEELNDIALVRLVKHADLNDYVNPICLSINEETEQKDTSMVVGWQQSTNISLLGNINERKHFGTVRFISLDECKQYVSNYKLTEQHFCVRDLLGSARCVSDSGGPIVNVFGLSSGPLFGRFYVNGILREKICYADERNPSIYINTKVDYFVNWILDNLKP